MNERERIEFILSVYGLSPSQFADKTGIPRASVSHILSGRNRPSLDVLQKVATVFPSVDLNWLVLGVGNPPALPGSMPVADVLSPQEANETLFSNEYETVVEEEKMEKTDAVLRNVKPSRVEAVKAAKAVQARANAPERNAKKTTAQRTPADASKYIKEIRVFYSDGTYEILYPEK